MTNLAAVLLLLEERVLELGMLGREIYPVKI